jgi:hypothetical protein
MLNIQSPFALAIILKHSMIKLPDLNFVTFFSSPAQPDCFFYGDIFCD